MQHSYSYVDTPSQLDALVERINAAQWVAVDTEFVRERTYYPVLCLLQIGTPDWCDLVDPLAKLDLSTLWQALYRPSLCKVFHAADQDLEIFTQLQQSPPPNLFDTQLAAPLLGHAEGMGYARLVEAITGVALSKDQTRADWSQRPLPTAALRYAADDVIHLAAIYPLISESLTQLGRDSWLEDDLNALEDASRYRRDPERAAIRLKGLDRLNAAQQSRAQQLAIWREKMAQQTDQPKGWLISDGALQTLARRNPRDINELKRIRDIKPAVINAYANEIISVLRDAPDQPALPIKKPRKKSSKDRRALLDALSARVALIAADQSIHPDTLVSRADLEKWLENPASGFDPAWRHTLLFDALTAMLSGKDTLRVVDGEVVVNPD